MHGADASQRADEVLPADRLDQVVGGAERRARAVFSSRIETMITGTARVAVVLAQLGEHLPAVEAGQPDVEHDGRRAEGADQLQPLLAVPCVHHLHAEPVEVRGHQVERRAVVVDDHHDRQVRLVGGRRRVVLGGAAGSAR